MSDIIIAGNTYTGVPKIVVPAVGGGTAEFGVWNPWGEDAELINTYDMGTKKLSETGFNGWTPSTTASSIQATSTIGTITAPALDVYEYGIKTVFDSNTAYTAGTTLKAAVIRQIFCLYQIVHRKPSSIANMESETDNYNYCATFYTAPWMYYYDTSGALKAAWTGSYGIYPSATAATFGSSTGTNTTVTIKAPVYNARCYKSYFSTTVAPNVDQENSTIKCKVYVYRYKKDGSTLKKMYDDVVDVFNA